MLRYTDFQMKITVIFPFFSFRNTIQSLNCWCFFSKSIRMQAFVMMKTWNEFDDKDVLKMRIVVKNSPVISFLQVLPNSTFLFIITDTLVYSLQLKCNKEKKGCGQLKKHLKNDNRIVILSIVFLVVQNIASNYHEKRKKKKKNTLKNKILSYS